MNIPTGPTDNPLSTISVSDNTSTSPVGTKKTEGKASASDGPTTAQLLGGTANPSTPTLAAPSSPLTSDSLQAASNDLQFYPPRANIWLLISEVMILSIRQDNQLEKASNSSVTSDSLLQVQSSQAAAEQDKSAGAWALGLGIAGGLVSVVASAISMKTSITSMNLTKEAASVYEDLAPIDENYASKQFENLTQQAGALTNRGQAYDMMGQAISGLVSGISSSKQDDKQAAEQELQANATQWQTLVSQLQNFLGAIQQNEQSTTSLVQSLLGAQADQKNIPI